MEKKGEKEMSKYNIIIHQRKKWKQVEKGKSCNEVCTLK